MVVIGLVLFYDTQLKTTLIRVISSELNS